eukprot:5819804-Alexandrium_andersonii.AAC.1
MSHNTGMAGVNMEELAGIHRLLTNLSVPFLLAGDWNMSPDVLCDSGWPSAVGVQFVESGLGYTCIPGGGGANHIDYVFASPSLCPLLQ